MTKDEALDLALDIQAYNSGDEKYTQAITAIKQALAVPVCPACESIEWEGQPCQICQTAPVQEPLVFYRCDGCGHAYEEQHPTSCDCMEGGGFKRVDYYTTPPATPVPKGMVLLPKRMTQAMRDVTDQEDWTWEDLLAAAETITEDEYNEIVTPPAAPVPVEWMEMVTANLVREGVNKHNARELAEHFYSLAQRQWVGLTTEEIYACDDTSGLPQHEITNADLQAFAYAIEAKLREKNNR